MVALSGDTFEFEGGSVAVKHLRPELLSELERGIMPRRPRNNVDDDDLRKVAEIVERTPYRERRRAVAEALHVDYYVAKARIAAARKKGFL